MDERDDYRERGPGWNRLWYLPVLWVLAIAVICSGFGLGMAFVLRTIAQLGPTN